MRNIEHLLLDMNGTFMFGQDRFGDGQDYAATYRELGGTDNPERVNTLISDAFAYLDARYADPDYRYCFPGVREALEAVREDALADTEIERLVDVFALHELGTIPPAYVEAIERLASRFTIGLVIDIWAPPDRWRAAFREAGIDDSLEAVAFSSESGIVKPAPEPFVNTLEAMGGAPDSALVVGDSVRRDLGAAQSAGIDCVLVGGAVDDHAVACFPTLLDFAAIAVD